MLESYDENSFSVRLNKEVKSKAEKIRSLKSAVHRCAACGAEAHRGKAKFCLVCGKFLGEDYQPLDSLRSSHRLHGRMLPVQPPETLFEENLFEQRKNAVALTAWACLVYSLVPYLGILFVPFTLFFSIGGYATALRRPQLGGKKLSATIFALNLIVASIQYFLWWLLYFIPRLPSA